ncbi:hypothetical protein V7S43_003435 [Phytophthora oleae]|uniref:Uncharacterized protein n=1 Tax=Phytophthora oleae TaxID=2107226 RepID=A0ABD3G0T4_9STRA
MDNLDHASLTQLRLDGDNSFTYSQGDAVQPETEISDESVTQVEYVQGSGNDGDSSPKRVRPRCLTPVKKKGLRGGRSLQVAQFVDNVVHVENNNPTKPEMKIESVMQREPGTQPQTWT